MRRGLAITRKALGEGHPLVAQAYSDLAASMDLAGKPEESLALQKKALVIWEQALPNDHPALASAYTRMASANLHAGRTDRAIELFHRALAVRTRAYGPKHPMTANIHFNLGVVHNQLGQLDEAQAEFEQAAAGFQGTQGPDSAQGAIALYAVCGMLRMKGQLEEGLERCKQSLAIWEQTGGKHKGFMARTLVAIGQAQLGLKHPERAIAPLERALKLHGEYKPPPLEVAEARFELAHALWDAQRDRPRARELAQSAWSYFKEAKDAPAEQRAEVAAWIKAHGGR
jgi:tetratricopeptide (TPR) repeat protein